VQHPDENTPGRRSDDVVMPVVLHRLTELEHRVDVGFGEVRTQIAALTFVRQDVFEAKQAARDAEIETMKADIVEARRPGIWALSLVLSSFIMAIVAAAVRLGLGL
jgi:hypothetical protein